MYKYYINDVCILLADKSNMDTVKQNPAILSLRYKNQKELKQFINGWENYEGSKTVCLYHHNVDKLKYYFIKNYSLQQKSV